MNQRIDLHDVMTLEEAARYLRVPKKKIEALAERGEIPARRVDASWRFLKPALDDWLRGTYAADRRTAQLAQAGRLANDETMLPMLAEIYKARGRPETEDGAED